MTTQTQQVRQINQRRARKNKRFQAATAAEKRVMVAKDVLQLLDAKKIRAEFDNTYVQFPAKLKSKETDVATVLEMSMTKLNPCTVCGIGAAMVCDLLIKDKLQLGQFWHGDDMTNNSVIYQTDSYDMGEFKWSKMVGQTFPPDLLRAIELAFESGYYDYHRVESANDRVRAVYQNIIKNKGIKFTAYGDPKCVIWGRGAR